MLLGISRCCTVRCGGCAHSSGRRIGGLPLWLLAAAMMVVPGALASFAHAQAHGIGIAKTCISPRKVGQINECRIRVTYNDGFQDTLAITDVFDVVDPGGQNIMIPFGDLQIVEVEGNTTAVVGGTLPVLIGPEGSTAMGLPGEDEPGIVTFIQNTYVIDADDPNPLQDQANVVIVDLCDAQGTMGCSSIPSTVQFTAATDILNPAMMVQKSAEPSSVCPTGEDVTYTYMVTNVGDADLEAPTVVDDTSPCENPTFVGGDTMPFDGLLSPGETWIYECVSPNVTQPVTNTVTVTTTVTEIPECILTEMDSASVEVFPEPPCTIDGMTAVCQNGLLQFTGPANLVSYEWSTGGDCGQIFGASNEQSVTIGFPNVGQCTVMLTVTDKNGCTSSCELVVTVNPLPPCFIEGDGLACEGATLEFAGPIGLASYTWATQGNCGTIIGAANESTVMIQFPSAGTCTVLLTVVDENGCTTEPCSLAVNVVENPVVNPPNVAICLGTGPGQICANPSGGTAPYMFAWTGPGGFTAMTECIDVTVEGTYQVIVTDANGCVSDSGTGFAEFTINPVPMLTPTVTEICDGDPLPVQLCANATGGTQPYTFLWSTGATTPCIDVDMAGTFTVTVTDANGCTVGGEAMLTINPTPVVDPDVVVECDVNDPPVEICSNPSGGTLPYTFAWTGPGGFTAATECISVSTPGTYTVMLTDANGCTAMGSGSYTLNPTPTATPDDVVLCDGDPIPVEICSNASGGTLPYTFDWTGPGGFTAMTECIQVSAPGTYMVTVTDANGCFVEASGSLTINPTPMSKPDAPVLCEGDAVPVEICSNPFGGTLPYTFAWTGPGGFTAMTECIQASVPGTYTVTVTDFNGCSVTEMTSLTINPTPSAAPDNPVLCEGDAVPVELCSNPMGGTAPYTFAWTGPGGFTAMTECIQVSDPGTYMVTVTDVNGCFVEAAGSLTINPTPSAAPDSPVLCEGDAVPVQICANASGGTAPYTFSWTGPGGFTAVRECIMVSDPGTYTVTVTDVNGCAVTESGTLTINPTPSAAPDNPVLCEGDAVPVELCSNPMGGTAPYTFAWTGPGGFTAMTECIQVSAPGTYMVTVTDVNGCFVEAAGSLTINPTPSAAPDNPVLCEGDAVPVELCSNPMGGTAPYTFSWTGPGGFTAMTECIQVSAPGTYMVTVTDVNGCFVEAAGSLTINPTPSAAPDNPVLCDGDAIPVELCSNPMGGTAPYTFAWTGPGGFTAMTECIQVSDPGTYMVTVTDANGCFVEAAGSLTINPTPSAAPDNPVLCDGDAIPVELCSNPMGGTAPYTFAWTGPGGFTAMTECIQVSAPGTYMVTVTDVNGCFVEAAGSLTINPTPMAKPDAPVLCEGDAVPVELCSNPFGGTLPYTFAWTGPNGFTAMTECIQVSDPGTYTVTVTDVNGCSVTEMTSLTINPTPSAAPDNPVLCEGDAVPVELCSNPMGGTAPYTFAWTGPGGFTAMTECIQVSDPGTYMVTVTDVNGCFVEAAGSLTINPTPSAAPDNPVLCEGDAVPVELCSNPMGGTAPYTFAWTGPGGFTAMTECIQVSDPGTYMVTVTDANGCSATASGSLTINPTPSAAPDNPVLCDGDAIPVELCSNPMGGTAPYTFAWTGPGGFTAMTECIQVSAPGTYMVTVTDVNGCFVEAAGSLTINPTPMAKPDAPVLCEGDAVPVELCSNPFGGTLPYTFAWTGPNGFTAMTECIQVSDPGTYTVTVTDVNGCSVTEMTSLTINPTPSAAPDNPVLCDGNATPVELCSNPMGGSAPYTFAWTGPGGFAADTECIQVTAPGTYMVTVTDVNGCEVTASGSLTINPTPSAAPDNPVICDGDGVPVEMCANASGGTAPYTFSWTGPGGFAAATECIDVSDAGTYTVEVTDANGCTATASGTFTINPTPSVQPDGDAICEGEGPVEICANASGGTAPYTFAWTGPGGFTAMTECIDVSDAGTYMVTVTDANGCTASGSADLTVNPNPIANPSDDVICEDEGPGAICANASGGTAPYTYEWTGPGGFTAMTECIDVTDAGTYMVTVTDANGCTGTGSADLIINPNPIANPMDVELCEEELPVELCANASGGTAPYTYLWSNGETTECIEVDAAGTFSVTVTDANGCSGDGTATVTVNPRPTAAPPSAVVCEEALPGEICAEASGGTGPYTYEWTGPNGFSSTDECISVTDPGSYCVTVTDANGCVSVEACAVFDVLETPEVAIVAPGVLPDCGSEGNTLMATISGGRPPYTSSWSVMGSGWEITSGQGTDTITYTAGDATMATFMLTVTDSNGCSASADFTLECIDCVPPACFADVELVCVEEPGSGSSGSGAHSSSSGSGSGSVGSSGSSGSSGTPYSSGSSASSSWSYDDGFDTGSSASGSHSGSGSGSSSSGPGSGSAGSSGSSGSSGTPCSSGSSGSSSGGSLSGAHSSSSGPGSGSIGSSGSSGSSGTSQSSGSSSSSSSAHDGLTDSGSSASHGSGGSGSNSGASGSNSGSSGSSGAGGELLRRISFGAIPSTMGELCEPVQIEAVIDIGCALIPVQDGELIDLECLCQEGSGSSGSHSGSSGGHSGSSGSDWADWAEGADWSSASGSSSDSSQSGHSNSSGGSGGSAVRRCDCGEPSSGSSASASSLSSGGSVSSSSSGTGSSGGSGSSGWGSSSSGSDGPGDFIEDSSSSGPGSGSIGSSGSSGSSGTSYSSGSSASSSSSGGGVCCEWTPAGLHNHLTIRSDMALLIVTVTDANGDVAECVIDLCEEPPSPPAPAMDLCDDGDKPAVLTMLYTGGNCDETSHDQDSGKVDCDEWIDPLPEMVYIVSSDDDHEEGDLIWFEGWVSVGDLFAIDAANGDRSRLKSETHIHILDRPGGDLLQTSYFHTSCSQPLRIGDQFGASSLMEFIADESDDSDVNADGAVDVMDMMNLLGKWGPCDCREDIDGNGMVDFDDVRRVLDLMQ